MTEPDMIFGWTLNQWAIALHRIGVKGQDLDNYIDVKCAWIEKYLNDPGEIKIEGIKVEKDWRTARQLRLLAQKYLTEVSR